MAVFKGLEQRVLNVEKSVAGDLALGAKLAIAGEENERPCRAIYFFEHSLSIAGFVEIILVGDGNKGSLAVLDGTVPVMGNSWLARINEELDAVLACYGGDAFVWR